MQHPLYRQAFNLYLRKGIPIHLSLKAAEENRPTTHYIWRTAGDDKVRPSHAANNGKIFAWDNPPETGHPGAAQHCRCVAEGYVQGGTEFAQQNVVSAVQDAYPQWTNVDLTRHFYLGGGRGVTLSEIGHLQGVINHYFYTLGKYNDVNAQIIEEARKHVDGEFYYSFGRSYAFRSYLYAFGGGVVEGVFVGSSQSKNGTLVIKGSVEYFYDDVFTDPVSIREQYDADGKPQDMSQIEQLTEFGGSYFPIKDYWKTEFYAEVHLDREDSIYRWQEI